MDTTMSQSVPLFREWEQSSDSYAFSTQLQILMTYAYRFVAAVDKIMGHRAFFWQSGLSSKTLGCTGQSCEEMNNTNTIKCSRRLICRRPLMPSRRSLGRHLESYLIQLIIKSIQFHRCHRARLLEKSERGNHHRRRAQRRRQRSGRSWLCRPRSCRCLAPLLQMSTN